MASIKESLKQKSWIVGAYTGFRSSYYVLRGGGADFLHHKKEYHRQREASERAVLREVAEGADHFEKNCCPVCASRDVIERFENKVGFSFAICERDGTIYMDPVPTESTLARLYNDSAYSYHWTEGSEVDQVQVKPGNHDDFDAILRMLPEKNRRLRMLDVGCATGAFMLTARQAFEVEGVELNETSAAVARCQGLIVHGGRLGDLEGRKQYDLITMLQLIEHIRAPRELLREAGQLLSPNGYLYIATPNIDSASFEYLKEQHMHVSSFAHVSLFTRESLLGLASQCGFALVHHEYYGGLDIALHDIVTFKFWPDRFYHRMSLYKPRLYHASNLMDWLTGGLLRHQATPKGNPSYQRVLFRKVGQG
ncbi:MAG TPA: class I SAM-dependent methyltransferase [Rhodothermales bacterium]|nr:class I SAM-dependent methyltransferase [Rhodothermales bacterium]